ncbi:flagellar M-ring protein FliF [Arsenicitalea aurantiaca]|uniref:Flagellar M-ring protein n=1 Tax=Arsenicitalea aurantiaca TaxID=1783274 RepID=A0A433XKW0_9HYPH|nr:flagellar basal-body MS-ring/collar protein FliF [Arsenicitalea aurantiaca]RUT34720.1 flagellar M-ring protein FliF [Arsenicitalea aurantiaca]
MDNFVNFLNRLGLARVAAMGVVAVLMLGFFVFLILRSASPQMAPLYSGLSIEDSSAIVSELQTANVPFQLRGEGDTILVPRDQITTLRMSLAADGLPHRGQVGYEIFDQQNTLGATSFVQNINNVRALEGELSRTISSLARIRSARVHLVLPERELFRRERQDPSASIVLGVRGELSAGEIRAIQHLVASAIEGLTPTRVSIVDDAGRLLASGAGTGEDGILAGELEERTLGVEGRLRARIEDLLVNVVGPGRARVQVSAQLDMNRLTRTSESFDPDGQVVRSTLTRELQNSAIGAGTSGQVSVANELPGASENAGLGGGTNEQQSTVEETVNYEISRVTETAMTEAGGISRLSIAVAVDGVYADDGSGNASYQPRSDAELAQIAALVRSAAGFDTTRGDQLEVVNMQFAERPELAALGTQGQGLFDFTRDDLMQGAEMAVTLLIALALVFFVMRPLLGRVLTPETAPLALPASAELSPSSGAVERVDEGPEANLVRKPAWMDGARAMGETQAQTLKTVGTLVDENPKQAALIVRDWISDAA